MNITYGQLIGEKSKLTNRFLTLGGHDVSSFSKGVDLIILGVAACQGTELYEDTNLNKGTLLLISKNIETNLNFSIFTGIFGNLLSEDEQALDIFKCLTKAYSNGLSNLDLRNVILNYLEDNYFNELLYSLSNSLLTNNFLDSLKEVLEANGFNNEHKNNIIETNPVLFFFHRFNELLLSIIVAGSFYVENQNPETIH